MYELFIYIVIISLFFSRGLVKKAPTILSQLQIKKGVHHIYMVRLNLVTRVRNMKAILLRARFIDKYSKPDINIMAGNRDPYCQRDADIHRWARDPAAMEATNTKTLTAPYGPGQARGSQPHGSGADRKSSGRGYVAKARPSTYELTTTTSGRKRLKRAVLENSLSAFSISKLPMRSIHIRLPTANAIHLYVADYSLHAQYTTFSHEGQRNVYGKATPP